MIVACDYRATAAVKFVNGQWANLQTSPWTPTCNPSGPTDGTFRDLSYVTPPPTYISVAQAVITTNFDAEIEVALAKSAADLRTSKSVPRFWDFVRALRRRVTPRLPATYELATTAFTVIQPVSNNPAPLSGWGVENMNWSWQVAESSYSRRYVRRLVGKIFDRARADLPHAIHDAVLNLCRALKAQVVMCIQGSVGFLVVARHCWATPRDRVMSFWLRTGNPPPKVVVSSAGLAASSLGYDTTNFGSNNDSVCGSPRRIDPSNWLCPRNSAGHCRPGAPADGFAACCT